MPPEYDSKLDCIYLVALCEAENTKQKDASLNDIFELMVKELAELVTDGLQIEENTNLKTFLFNFSSDNLGINGALGFMECFAVDGMCRFCEMTKEEWRMSVCEDESKLRTKSAYMESLHYIDSLDENKQIDLKISKGIKSYCALNNLQYFDILQIKMLI